MVDKATPPEGYVTDYISGQRVKATPEEMEAVQVFSRRLVEEYGYSKEQIQTRPQFRIKASPSGEEKYPADIAVFSDENKFYDNLYIIVECKRKNRKDGEKQLKIYMGLSAAQIGVWFNGEEHLYLQKILDAQGHVTYRELPNIPKNGQRIDDVGKFRRRDLKPPTNLKVIFRDLRNHLVGMTTGITRDEPLAQELINILFCKIYDEIRTPLEDEVTFRAGVGEDPGAVKQRISWFFETHVKAEYADVFEKTDTITLDPESLFYVVGELQNYCLIEAERDAIADAFETFIGPALRGPEGQFFTPRNVVRMMIDILDPSPGEYVLDPACGSGGFLIGALERIWKKQEEDGRKKGWSVDLLAKQKADVATKYFRGIDKDAFLAKVTKAYMAIVGDGRGGVFCENSLKSPEEWDARAQEKIKLGAFDIVVTNPPFGSKIKVKGDDILEQYELGCRWKKEKGTNDWVNTGQLRGHHSPEVLFIERCLQFLKPGGTLGIILPESIFGNPTHGYIVSYLLTRGRILGIVSMPEDLFQPYTHNKTCVVFLERNNVQEEYNHFMAAVKWCGHESRGRQIHLDEVPLIAPNYFKLLAGPEVQQYNRLGFMKRLSEIRNNIFIPKYYDPDIEADLDSLADTHELVSIQHLVNERALSISTGDEVGKLSYGTGTIPFIRTSDLANWELKIDPKHGVDEETYAKYKTRQDVKEHDILMVRDGTYLIGTTAMITKYDTEILFQSHLYRLRVLKPERASPFLLLAVLNSPLVKRQVRAKQFTQDIIDTLGSRILEIVLPLPKDPRVRQEIVEETQSIVEARAELRQKAKALSALVEGKKELTEEEELAEIL